MLQAVLSYPILLSATDLTGSLHEPQESFEQLAKELVSFWSDSYASGPQILSSFLVQKMIIA